MGGSIQGTPLSLARTSSTLAGSSSIGSSDGTGTAARFFGPSGVATDGTNLYIVDTGNNTIRKLAIGTGAVTTIAGTPGSAGSADDTGAAARFRFPYGITTDGRDIYVADTSNHTIRKVTIATGEVTTFAGSAGSYGSADGTGASARFAYPVAITTDGRNLYVADTSNNTIRQIVIGTREVTTLAGIPGSVGSADGIGVEAAFNSPHGITTDGRNLYVADTNNYTIRKVVIATREVTTFAGSAGSSGSADGTYTTARFRDPCGITTDGTNLYVSDTGNLTIRRIVIDSGTVTTLAGTPGSIGTADGTGADVRF
jgi:sugar lactone lactonase YvrE